MSNKPMDIELRVTEVPVFKFVQSSVARDRFVRGLPTWTVTIDVGLHEGFDRWRDGEERLARDRGL